MQERTTDTIACTISHMGSSWSLPSEIDRVMKSVIGVVICIEREILQTRIFGNFLFITEE